ncbi:sorting nexin-21-like [Mytilus californianus]|uniref:sorting nexin-21-like n=1 Tax=Mytilus californianus TaxID=6549 RepID=UPI0022485A50|nr:sorting nexin-21-like [Mytilus californianus]
MYNAAAVNQIFNKMPLKRLDCNDGHSEESQDELLADDSDVFENRSSNLTLEIGLGDLNEEPSTPSSPGCVSIESNRESVGYVNFEVISAERVKDGNSTYVVYQILISGHGIEKTPGILHKRYSDFEKFNVKLRKKFPEIMDSVSFPGKVLVGNFKNETIAKRSRAFEQYLNHLMSLNEIRFSGETKEFFYENEISNANEMIGSKNYSEAISLLEKCLPVQEKLIGTTHIDVIKTLCALVVCYQALKDPERALKYSTTGLSCMEDSTDNPYYLPLLHTSIYLHWMLGKEKTHLEVKLGELRDQGIATETNTNLLDTVVKELKS